MSVSRRCSNLNLFAFFAAFCFASSFKGASAVTAEVPYLRFKDLPPSFYENNDGMEGLKFRSGKTQSGPEYAIVIDSGSTGNRVHIYTYSWDKNASASPTVLAVTVGGDTWSLRTKPAINAFANNPQNVSQSLTQVIQYAKDHIPNNTWSSVPLWLKATAGMRVLTPTQQDQIMRYVREYLTSTPFDFRSAQVIEGWQEGAFAWISVNYLTNRLGGTGGTEGALDLGGASTQIVFQPTQKIITYGSRILVGVGNNYTYEVYAWSYNGYGLDSVWATAMQYQAQNAAKSAVIQAPCLPLGALLLPNSSLIPSNIVGNNYTFNGTGNLTGCKSVVMASLMPTTTCPPSYLGQCSGIHGTYQAIIPTGYPFMAFSGYVYTRDFLKTNMGVTGVTYDLYVNGYNAYFNKTAQELQQLDPSNAFVPQFGFNAVYIAALLEAMKLTSQTNTPLTIQSNLTNSKGVSLNVGWTLGAMVYEVVNDLYAPTTTPSRTRIPGGAPKNDGPPSWVWIIVGVGGALLVLIIVVVLVMMSRRRKGTATGHNAYLVPN